jgi:hypothetical protein
MYCYHCQISLSFCLSFFVCYQISHKLGLISQFPFVAIWNIVKYESSLHFSIVGPLIRLDCIWSDMRNTLLIPKLRQPRFSHHDKYHKDLANLNDVRARALKHTHTHTHSLNPTHTHTYTHTHIHTHSIPPHTHTHTHCTTSSMCACRKTGRLR